MKSTTIDIVDDGSDGAMDDDLLEKLCEADKIPLFAGATMSLLDVFLLVLTIR